MQNKKKILVTGGAGYIGSHTVVSLIESNYIPVILDDFRNSESFILDRLAEITDTKIIHYNGACQDKALLQQIGTEHQIDGVIHFAADKAVGESVHHPLKYYHNNISALVAILEFCETFNVPNLVFSSSCSVYGDHPKLGDGITEQVTDFYPQSPYARTKKMAEDILHDWKVSQADKNICILRYFNPIGAHPSAKIGELPLGVPNNLLPFITQTAVGIREKLTVFGKDYATPDGTCIRDYIHVVDLADAHVNSLDWLIPQTRIIDTFNVGTGKGQSVLEILHIFEEVSKISLNWTFGEKREGDVPVVFANNDKIKTVLGWQPQFSVKDAVSHAWEWQKTLK